MSTNKFVPQTGLKSQALFFKKRKNFFKAGE